MAIKKDSEYFSKPRNGWQFSFSLKLFTGKVQHQKLSIVLEKNFQVQFAGQYCLFRS